MKFPDGLYPELKGPGEPRTWERQSQAPHPPQRPTDLHTMTPRERHQYYRGKAHGYDEAASFAAERGHRDLAAVYDRRCDHLLDVAHDTSTEEVPPSEHTSNH